MTRRSTGSHAAPRASRRSVRTVLRSRRVKAALALGVVVCLGASTTWASWSDKGTITGAAITTGTLDLTAGPSTGSENLAGTGTASGTDTASSWTNTELAISNLAPGESLSKTIVLRNSGTAPFTVNGVVTTTTNDLVSGTTGLQVQVYDQSTAATNTGTQADGNRAGTCSGTTPVYSQYPTTTSTTAIYTSAPKLTSTQTRSLCVRVVLDASAPNSLQSTTASPKSTKVVIKLDAAQATS